MELLTVTEAAETLKVSRKTVLRWIRSGKLEAIKPGRDWRIPMEALERLFEK